MVLTTKDNVIERDTERDRKTEEEAETETETETDRKRKIQVMKDVRGVERVRL